MRRTKQRRGFTLVELLVVITIIGMLVAMLLPAVQGAREAGRRIDCMNKQHQWGLAMHNYNTFKTRLPGFYNWVGKNKAPGAAMPYYWGSWMVSLFPYMERMDLWDQWSNGNAANAVVNLGSVHCPSAPSVDSALETAFSYQVNSGRLGLCSYDTDGDPNNGVQSTDVAATGVFDVNIPEDVPGGDPTDAANHWPEFLKRRSSSLNAIRDGTTTTLMLSENTQEENWDVYPTGSDLASAAALSTFLVNVEPRLCFCVPTTRQTSDPTAYPTGMEYINQHFDDPTRCIPSGGPYGGAPASYHPDGVVVTFCDNHQYFLTNNVNLQVFLHLMTSNSRRAAEVAFGATPAWEFYPLLFKNSVDSSEGMSMLDEGDY